MACRRISSEDVTEQYVDIDARLRTMVALRDRLRALLDKAQDVKDILTIEIEALEFNLFGKVGRDFEIACDGNANF